MTKHQILNINNIIALKLFRFVGILNISCYSQIFLEFNEKSWTKQCSDSFMMNKDSRKTVDATAVVEYSQEAINFLKESSKDKRHMRGKLIFFVVVVKL